MRDKVGGEDGVAEARGAELEEMGVDDVRPLTHSSTHQSLSPMHTHTLHSLRKWLVHLSKSPTGMQGGTRGLLQQLLSKLTQPLHSVILGDPPCGHPHLQTDTESSPLRTTHNTTFSLCLM